jgi:recombination protein RecA
MSSQLIFPRAATSREIPFSPAHPPSATALLCKHLSQKPRLVRVTPASYLEIRRMPEMLSTGISEIDSLSGGFPRGCLTEVCGPASSGRSGVLLASLAATIQKQEICALVDTTDSFDPGSACTFGIHGERLLWIRCSSGNQQEREFAPGERTLDSNRSKVLKKRYPLAESVDRALRITDLLLQSSGFGMVVLDLGDVPVQTARRIPLTSWFRFRRAVENTPTVLLAIGQQSCARECASLSLQLEGRAQCMKHGIKESTYTSSFPVTRNAAETNSPPHTELMQGIRIRAEILHSRLQRKPMHSVRMTSEPTRKTGES